MANENFYDFLNALPSAGNLAGTEIVPITKGGSQTFGTTTQKIANIAAGFTTTTTVASSGTSQALAFPSNGSKAYDITLTANCTITLSGGTAGQTQFITLFLRQGGAGGFTPTLPTVKWSGGIAPTPNTVLGKIDVYTFFTPDGGVTLFGKF